MSDIDSMLLLFFFFPLILTFYMALKSNFMPDTEFALWKGSKSHKWKSIQQTKDKRHGFYLKTHVSAMWLNSFSHVSLSDSDS